MTDRRQNVTVWVMLIGVVIAFTGVFIYATFDSSIGYTIVVLGVLILGFGVVTNIGLSIGRSKKRDS